MIQPLLVLVLLPLQIETLPSCFCVGELQGPLPRIRPCGRGRLAE